MVEGPRAAGATEQRVVLAPQHRPLLHGDNEACDIPAPAVISHITFSLFFFFADLGFIPERETR